MNLKHSCLISSSRTHRTRPLLQQTGMPRQLCPTADAQLHAAANAAATSCDHHGGIHLDLGINPEARLLLTLHKLHHAAQPPMSPRRYHTNMLVFLAGYKWVQCRLCMVVLLGTASLLYCCTAGVTTHPVLLSLKALQPFCIVTPWRAYIW